MILLFLPHFFGISYIILKFAPLCGLWFVLFLLFSLLAAAKLFILPTKKQSGENIRLYAMHGGEIQLSGSFLCSFIQIFLYYTLLARCGIEPKNWVFITDLVLTLVFIWSLAMSGIIRVIITSTWLNVVDRILCIVFLFMPIVNLFVMIYMARTAALEYEYFSYKEQVESERSDDICQTKYPIVMVHGVGFRDLHYFNYWGRIPKALEKHGATVYYGHQEAWGDIVHNAEDIAATIKKVIEETGAEKVNIIAHSKGGLDSRYAISKLGMAKYVASLTTVCTPHRGSPVADFCVKLPPSFFNICEKYVNNMFKRFGDTRPDFRSAAHDLTSAGAEEFNKNCPDAENVYYQSYACVLGGIFSDRILPLPYTYIVLATGKPNDGLVTEDSAKWGTYKGTFKNKHIRGISHGDIIDLKRENFRGFDVTEKFIDMVSDLKNNGF